MQNFVLLAAVLATTALAIETRAPAMTPRDIFNKIDTNRDEMISHSEAKAYLIKSGAPAQHLDAILGELFKAEDKNKDGVVSWAEWNDVNGEPPATNTRPARLAAGGLTNNNAHHSDAAAFSTLSRFAATVSNTDEDDDDEDLEDYQWVDFSEDTKGAFCDEELAAEDSCWHKVYWNEKEKYHYACVTDEKTDESKCFTIRME